MIESFKQPTDWSDHACHSEYYSSPELFEELHCCETFAAGTCRVDRKKLPKGVTKAKLKEPGDCVFRRNGPLLCFKWQQKERKKGILMLSTIHEAILDDTGKKDVTMFDSVHAGSAQGSRNAHFINRRQRETQQNDLIRLLQPLTHLTQITDITVCLK